MADPRFFQNHGPFRLDRLAEIAEATLHPQSDPKNEFVDVAPLETAGPSDISFLENRKYAAAFADTKAGACIVAADCVDDAPQGVQLLISDYPYRSYGLVAQAFYPESAGSGHRSPAAIVDETAILAEDVDIEPGAVVGAGAKIGARTRIAANAVIGPNVEIGEDCWIGPCSSVRYALLGDRVRIFAGARIGEDGFGFAPGPDRPVNIPQLGRVLIEDDVEIGSNACIDRGAGPDTVIECGARIDNLVQIAHNVRVGRGAILAGQAGVSGSTTIGPFAMLGGQAGLAGHLTVGGGAQIGAQGGVFTDVEAKSIQMGSPARPIRQFWREVATLKRLAGKKST